MKLAPVFVVTVSVAGCARDVPIEDVAERYPELVNPLHPQHGTIYKDEGDGCYVELPFETPPSSAGMRPPMQSVQCPEEMRDPAWNQCIGNDVRANARRTGCVCDIRGNPPPPTVPKIDCPPAPPAEVE